MAISWSPGSGASNPHFVGIDVDQVTATSARVRFYARAQYWVDDNQTLNWWGAATGSHTFRHQQSGGQTILLRTITITGTQGQTREIAAEIAGIYNGGTPRVVRAVTFGSAAPGAPWGVSSLVPSRGQGSRFVLDWEQVVPPAVTRFDLQRIQRGHGWATIVRPGGTARQHIDTGTVPNAAYRWRIAAENSAGTVGWTTILSWWFTAPAAPLTPTASRMADGSVRIAWGRAAYEEAHYEVRDANTLEHLGFTAAHAYEFIDTDPDLGQVALYDVRAVFVNHGTTLTSAWVRSNPLQLLGKPNPPTGLSSFAVDPDATQTQVRWRHNPVDGTPQHERQIRTASPGSTDWTTGTATSTSEEWFTWAAGHWPWDRATPDGFDWQVRTRGQHADWSDWSATAEVRFARTPVATLTTPEDGQPWTSPQLTLAFGSTEPVAQWRATVNHSSGAQHWAGSGSGLPSSISVPTPVADQASYLVSVQVLSTDGLWSEPVTAEFPVAFPPPQLMEATVAWDPETGWATVQVRVDSESDGTTPTHFDLLRSNRDLQGPWELLAEHVPVGDAPPLVDSAAAVDGRALWLVRSRDDGLGTFRDGRVATTDTQSPDGAGYLSFGPGLQLVLPLIFNPSTDMDFTHPGRQLVTLDGGVKPRRVQLDTPEARRRLAFSGVVRREALEMAEEAGQAKGAVLFRDSDGRWIVGSLEGPRIGRGVGGRWWPLQFSVDEIDHDMTVVEASPLTD